jgi:hypothetical protein
VTGDQAVALADLPQASGPPLSRFVIAGCSRRKAAASVPLPALDLYQGGCIPGLRSRLGNSPELRARIRILSAKHGLLNADRLVLPCDHRLDPERAAGMLASVTAGLARDWAETGAPQEVLVIAEPLYLVPLAAMLATPAIIHWVPDLHDTATAERALTRWSWV